MRKFIITSLKEFISENTSVDYSGNYESLRTFILDNDLQQKFVDMYSSEFPELNIDNYDDFTTGEIGADEEIIVDLIGNDYKIFYDEDNDEFIVTKKKVKIPFKISKSSDVNIIDVIERSGIYTEFEPRFKVSHNDTIIGGSSFLIDDDNVYNFDIGVLDEYQGVGISNKLIKGIIKDAKELGTNGIKAEVVNNILFQSLIKLGFEGDISSDTKYVYLNF